MRKFGRKRSLYKYLDYRINSPYYFSTIPRMILFFLLVSGVLSSSLRGRIVSGLPSVYELHDRVEAQLAKGELTDLESRAKLNLIVAQDLQDIVMEYRMNLALAQVEEENFFDEEAESPSRADWEDKLEFNDSIDSDVELSANDRTWEEAEQWSRAVGWQIIAAQDLLDRVRGV